MLRAVLQQVDAAALRQLKAASVAWCAHARRELCNRLWVRLSRREGQPEPAGVDSVTDLDVECLNEAGRPWEVVVAGRQLPQLARLHGFGLAAALAVRTRLQCTKAVVRFALLGTIHWEEFAGRPDIYRDLIKRY